MHRFVFQNHDDRLTRVKFTTFMLPIDVENESQDHTIKYVHSKSHLGKPKQMQYKTYRYISTLNHD